MDGNGRWASQRGLPRNAGHEQGETALFDTVEGALELGLRWLTVYAFSTENWKRPPSEVTFLMNFNRDLLLRRADELDERQVRVRFIGRRERPVPRRLVEMMERTERRTAHHRRHDAADRVQLRRSRGARRRRPAHRRRRGRGQAQAGQGQRASRIQARLYEPEAPDVDLLVRTSGEQRLSNFLLWEAAYAELVFTEVLWPDFSRTDLFAAVAEFQRRNRRFGKV